MMSWDMQSGFQHFYLHLDMRDVFVFRYRDFLYNPIALLLGWGALYGGSPRYSDLWCAA